MSEFENIQQPLPLPKFLMPFLGDCDWNALSWENNADFIIRRILQIGTGKDISQWVKEYSTIR